MKSNKKLTYIEFAIIGATIVILGVIGYSVFSKMSVNTTTSNQQTTNTTTPAKSNVPDSPNILSASDLDKAIQTLDKINPDSNDSGVSALTTDVANY